MEVLSRLLEEAVIVKKVFEFHPKCEKGKLAHLCCAYDLCFLWLICVLQKLSNQC